MTYNQQQGTKVNQDQTFEFHFLNQASHQTIINKSGLNEKEGIYQI
jgi:hypothetical protein